ncbi:MAG: hypothetical protein AAF944_20915 [Bacteroidota bacterium]
MDQLLKNGVYLTTNKTLVEFLDGQWYQLEPVRTEYKRGERLAESPNLEEMITATEHHLTIDGVIADAMTNPKSLYRVEG